MTNHTNVQLQVPPLASAAKIAMATVVALIVGSVILVTAVLPAEYGIDPLGTGKALGLTELANSTVKPAPVTAGADTPAVTIVPAAEGRWRSDGEAHIYFSAHAIQSGFQSHRTGAG